MKNVMLWAGAGQIGMAIARRMGTGMKIIVGDKKLQNAVAAAKTMNEAGFDVTPVEMDLSSRVSIKALIAEGQKYGDIKMLVNAAGVSPSQAPIEAILKVFVLHLQKRPAVVIDLVKVYTLPISAGSQQTTAGRTGRKNS